MKYNIIMSPLLIEFIDLRVMVQEILQLIYSNPFIWWFWDWGWVCTGLVSPSKSAARLITISWASRRQLRNKRHAGTGFGRSPSAVTQLTSWPIPRLTSGFSSPGSSPWLPLWPPAVLMVKVHSIQNTAHTGRAGERYLCAYLSHLQQGCKLPQGACPYPAHKGHLPQSWFIHLLVYWLLH